MKARLVLVLIAAAAAVAAGAVAHLTGVATAATPTLMVTSTLDGKSVLPHRIHWLGFPSIPPAKVAKVEFLIDGKLGWTEHKAPYVFAADDAGRNRGYLVTSWLAAGMHRFTVRVTANDGTIGTHTVTARVVAPPPPPSALAGTWHRTLDTTAAPRGGSAANPTNTVVPTGSYTLTFERRWARDKFPGSWVLPQSNRNGNGLVFLNDYTADATRVHLAGEVIFHPYSDDLAEGGSWCHNSGPPADYKWSVAGDTLTLAPVTGKDACGIRGFIWAGEWTRAG
jgi:hypothetical protein